MCFVFQHQTVYHRLCSESQVVDMFFKSHQFQTLEGDHRVGVVALEPLSGSRNLQLLLTHGELQPTCAVFVH